MTFYDVAKLFLDELECRRFLVAYGIFYNERICESCENPMMLNIERNCFRCNRRDCNKEISLRKGSFFYGSALACTKILYLGYQWLHKTPTVEIVRMTGHSSRTVCNFQKHFRNLVASDLSESSTLIGGEGIIVEIDESKLGKRKYNRGHPVEGVWVVGGIERTSEKKLFIVPVENRCRETLFEIIHRYVRPGSIIYTDLWRGYCGLNNEGFYHETVNHSQVFVDPITGVHTNTIEGSWNGLKLNFAPRHRTKDDIENRLAFYLWRRQNRHDLWNGLLKALRDIHYEFE